MFMPHLLLSAGSPSSDPGEDGQEKIVTIECDGIWIADIGQVMLTIPSRILEHCNVPLTVGSGCCVG